MAIHDITTTKISRVWNHNFDSCQKLDTAPHPMPFTMHLSEKTTPWRLIAGFGIQRSLTGLCSSSDLLHVSDDFPLSHTHTHTHEHAGKSIPTKNRTFLGITAGIDNVKNRKNKAPGLDYCIVPFPFITKLFVRFIEKFEWKLSNHPFALQVEVHIR
jgi:hypothetical protein